MMDNCNTHLSAEMMSLDSNPNPKKTEIKASCDESKEDYHSQEQKKMPELHALHSAIRKNSHLTNVNLSSFMTSRTIIPFEIAILIADYCDWPSLLALQFQSHAFYLACVEIAAKRISDPLPEGVSSRIVYGYCESQQKCIRCGLDRNHLQYTCMDPKLCIACEPINVQITRTFARDFFGVSDAHLRGIPVRIKPSQYRRGDTISLFNKSDVLELAYSVFGSDRKWRDFTRSRQLKRDSLRAAREANRLKQTERRQELESFFLSKNVPQSRLNWLSTDILFTRYVRKGTPRRKSQKEKMLAKLLSYAQDLSRPTKHADL